MKKNGKMSSRRERLVRAARRVVYRRGFNQTSLAQVATEASVPLGNFYYYFRTKDALGKALIDDMASQYRKERARWNKLSDPRERLLAFIRMTNDNSSALARSGCPIGSLSQELHKQGGSLADRSTGLFAEFFEWVAEQFQQLGKRSESPHLALQLMSSLQGATLLAHSFRSPAYISREVSRLEKWVRDL